MTVLTGHNRRLYQEGDPDMPDEFRTLLVRMLEHHSRTPRTPIT